MWTSYRASPPPTSAEAVAAERDRRALRDTLRLARTLHFSYVARSRPHGTCVQLDSALTTMVLARSSRPHFATGYVVIQGSSARRGECVCGRFGIDRTELEGLHISDAALACRLQGRRSEGMP